MDTDHIDNKLLILDIDETLLYATSKPLDRPHCFKVAHYHIYKRPHLKTFLNFCFSEFLVAIWTASTEDYAQQVINNIIDNPNELRFLWGRQRCSRKFNSEDYSYYFVKDLKKVKRKGYPLEQIIMVDDTPQKLCKQYGNLVRIAPFEGQIDDRELLDLIPYLQYLKTVENIRKIEKRGWKRRLLQENSPV